MTRLNQLSSDYQDAYGKVMDSIAHQEVDSKALAYQILGWVLHSWRPMTVLELQYALTIQEDTGGIIDDEDLDPVDMLLEVTQGLVTIHSGQVDYKEVKVIEFIRKWDTVYTSIS